MPNGSADRKGHVLLLTAEDSASDMVKPRLEAMEGDPTSVSVLRLRAVTGLRLPEHVQEKSQHDAQNIA